MSFFDAMETTAFSKDGRSVKRILCRIAISLVSVLEGIGLMAMILSASLVVPALWIWGEWRQTWDD